MELLTKIVILLTAVLGLYKTATLEKQKSGGKDGDGPFSFAIAFLGAYLPVLIVPGLMFGFFWLMNHMPGTSYTEPAAPQHVVPEIAIIPSNATDDEVLLFAVRGLSSPYSQAEHLTALASRSLAAHDFKMALRSALMQPQPWARDKALEQIIAAMTKQSLPKNSPDPK